MQFYELKNALQNFPVFSTRDIAKVDPDFHSQRLSEWQRKDYIRKIAKDYYFFSDLALNENVLFLIANSIYKHSYISFEMALSYYHLIPEGVYGITSATTLKTKVFHTAIGDFMYRHLKPGLMFGFKLVAYQDHFYKIADMEKAVLDFLYLNPQLNSEDGFLELRLNNEELRDHLNEEKINDYLSLFNNKLLEKRVKILLRYLNNA